MADGVQQFDDGLAEYVDLNDDGNDNWRGFMFPRSACNDVGEDRVFAFPNAKKKAISWKRLKTAPSLVKRISDFVNFVRSEVDAERTTVVERVFACCVNENPNDEDILHFGSSVEGFDGIDGVCDDLFDIFGDDKKNYEKICSILDQIVFRLYVTRIYCDYAYETSEDFSMAYAEAKELLQVVAPSCFFNKWLKTCRDVDSVFEVFTTMIEDEVPLSDATIGSFFASVVCYRDYPLLLEKIEGLMNESSEVTNGLLAFHTRLSAYCEHNRLFKNSGDVAQAAL